MHARVRDTIRHFVDGYMHCDKTISEPVVAKRPLIHDVVATSTSSHTGADRSLPRGIE